MSEISRHVAKREIISILFKAGQELSNNKKRTNLGKILIELEKKNLRIKKY